MSDSAIQGAGRGRGRRATQLRIADAAQRLADERGSVDGFTMEELAEASDVSRRTLFNHYPSKVDAVLGPELDLDSQELELFRSGGPTGDLVDDLQALLLNLLENEDVDVATIQRFDRIVHANPVLLITLKQRMRRLVEQLVDVAAQRPGGDLPVRDMQIAIAVVGGVTEAAVTAFVDDPEQDFAQLIVDGIATVRRLFG
ncbi:DNA-binding transcriptional regulator, AcrR family [Nocardioides exalbidus]|uniref:DNA-binding transcriptional regulator, AcrR family n=1 Tax=Nocardioides exalbidus TaxID=402596 RepID=A0A1H4K2D0_9ACTN|nr:TetR/AcrR family transcriptional regulator [Nocardioides exalbidus]SEB52690.1 DNA-binding transcriptional regulator, AcrR family [Nocardioides exalbidus]